MTPLEKTQWQLQLVDQLSKGNLSLGQAVQQIRTRLYQMTQADYARLCQVSEKTLREVEKGKTDPRISIVESLLRPGGLTLSARLQVNRVATMAELAGR
ncbi:helix-turn-helix domain-containing protein [Rheinheimera sp.]|uniref:helix-turn-helix domain-containing protein n=1 Tax=Rheinheimera sp. TaxID=1869214 RepID=UPI00307D7C01